MRLALKVFALFVVLLAVAIGVLWKKCTSPGPPPHFHDEWWGPGNPNGNTVEDIIPFKINISETVIQDLNSRLDRWRNPTKPLDKANFSYGFNTDYLQKVVQFWRKEYDWRDREAFLNSLPQFKTNIAGLNIHFVRVKPKNVPAKTKVLPMLLLHGWPGTPRDMYSVIPLLTAPREGQSFVFEVIVPSLPGYGFSDGPVRPGLGTTQIAVLMRQLMFRLGFREFIVQGGDWGGIIASAMATLYPQNVMALHSTFCLLNHPLGTLLMLLGQICPSMLVDPAYQDRLYPLSSQFSFLLEESGYLHLQSTKPDTIGVALADSPVGLAAYMLEKVAMGFDRENKHLPDGGLTKQVSLTDLLDSIMIFWVTGSSTTSIRLYAESIVPYFRGDLDWFPTSVPTACVAAPNEVFYMPKRVLLFKYPNLVQYTHPPRGGHFFVFEEPQLLANDIWELMSAILKKDSSKG